MKYISLFSGIEAATLAWKPLGWQAVGFSEIEPFPCAVLKHHYPNVPNIGDIKKVTQSQIESLGHVDVVVAGFPCQDLSVAGKRGGLKNADGSLTRSGLFYNATQIAEWAKARWFVGENVPGLFSSNEGRDFAAVVGELAGAEIGVPTNGWRSSGFALGPKGLVEWAILDAQYFGVPQRRRRVFIVRDSGDWRSRPPVLLEPESLSGNPPPSRKKGERIAGCLGGGSQSGGFPTTDLDNSGAFIPDTAWCLQERDAKGPDSDTKEGHLIPVIHDMRGNGEGNTAPTLTGDHLNRPTDYTPVVAIQDTRAIDKKQNKAGVSEGDNQMSIMRNSGVRRLTPVECARLQGFPDNYLDIPFRGKPATDSPKYKALGNSMAVPCMAWIGMRIQQVEDLIK